MNKTAKTKFPVNEIIKKRWSPRSFLNDQIPENTLHSLFEAAIWAPSSRNEQPWRFIYGTRDEGLNYDRIFGTLVHWNQLWAKLAPLLILTIAKKNSEYHNSDNIYALYDLGQAVANLTFQATSMGLHCHQMGGFDKEKAVEVFSIPPNFSPVTVIALGYIGNPELLPEDFKELEEKERIRYDMERMVFKDEFKP